MAKAMHILRSIGAVILRLSITGADAYLDFLMRTRANERAVPPTQRIRFPDPLRQGIRQQQGSLCMYCGVRLSRGNLHIDHIFPIEHGGLNVAENLQALCASCNTRKGVQTDPEFRQRYRELLPRITAGYRPTPPAARIPQSRFRDITARTVQLESTRARRRAIFKTARQKISGGSLTTGVVSGAVWFFAVAIVLGGESDAAAYLSLFGGIAVGLLVFGVLMYRARRTGRLDQ